MKVSAQLGSVKGLSISRDAKGFPKLGKEAAIKYWPMLNSSDRAFLKQKYSLNLEVGNG